MQIPCLCFFIPGIILPWGRRVVHVWGCEFLQDSGCNSARSLMRNKFFPSPEYILQGLIQIRISLLFDPLRDSICCFGDTAGDCRNRVAVAADGDRVSYCILKISAFKKCCYRLRNRSLAAYIKTVTRTNLIQGFGKIISVYPFNVFPDAAFNLCRIIIDRCIIITIESAKVKATHEDGIGNSQGAFDPFRMIMRYFCGSPGFFPGF